MPLRRLFRKYRGHTMVPEMRYVSNLELASGYRAIPGCVVEYFERRTIPEWTPEVALSRDSNGIR
jgi:hypothetical protein